MAEPTRESVLKQLRKVEDPELGCSIVDLGLVYKVKIDKGMVVVDMTFTSPACPLGAFIIAEVEKAAKGLKGVKGVHVNIVWEPLWSPDKMSEEAKVTLGI